MRVALIITALSLAKLCFADAEQEFTCKNCGLKGTYISGGTLVANGFPAYCTNKNHFVSVSWDYHKRPPKPVRLEGKVPVFKCWSCKTPTARKWDQQECPRCGSKKFKIRPTGLMVD
jgi:Zn finger protein HypA/HybF involved in hydrogenase expression